MKQALLPTSPRLNGIFTAIAPYFKRKRILYGSCVILMLVVIAALISLMHNRSNGFVTYQQNIEVLKHQGQLRIAIDDTVLDEVIEAEECQSYACSMDGMIAVFLTSNKELYLVKDQELKKIADDVLHFEISSTGMGVAFAQKYMDQYALTLYDPVENTRREITDHLSKLDFSLSPDGQSLAYYTLQENQDVLMCYYKGENSLITSNKSDLVGLSNDGKYIYAVCPKITGTSALYSFNRKGKCTELGTVTSIGFKFNADHQQIMFYNNGQTLVSTHGQQAVKVSSYPLYLVTAPNSLSAPDGNSITLPVSSLFDHVYTCSDGEGTGAWLIQRKPEDSKKIASEVSKCTLDASGKYLYFIYKQTQLCVVNVFSGSNPIQTLADDADIYAVSSDRSKVYYTNNGVLYCTKGKKASSTKIVHTNVTDFSLFLGNSDAAYFISEDNLYISKHGGKGKFAIKGIQGLYNSSNNVVYIIGNGDIYTAYRKSKPVKILGTE